MSPATVIHWAVGFGLATVFSGAALKWRWVVDPTRGFLFNPQAIFRRYVLRWFTLAWTAMSFAAWFVLAGPYRK